MRYLVAGSAIGDEGRDVRCANCNYQWFQEPKGPEDPLQEAESVEQAEAAPPAATPVLPEASENPAAKQQEQDAVEEGTGTSQDESEGTAAEGEDTKSQIDVDSIEEVSGSQEETNGETQEKDQTSEETSVQDPLDPEKDLPEALSGPIEDDHLLATPEALEEVAALEKKKMIVGVALAAGVFALVVGTLIGMKGTIIKAMPSAIAFYESYGMRTPVPGADLIFDQLQAVATRDQEGVNNLKITGKIMNISEEDSALPPILVALRSEEEKTTESWVVYPKEKGVPGAGAIEFDSAYPGLADESASVNVSFFVGKKALQLPSKSSDLKEETEHSLHETSEKEDHHEEDSHKEKEGAHNEDVQGEVDSHKDDGHSSDH